MKRFVEGQDRSQLILLPDCLDDYVGEDNPVRIVDAFIDELDLAVLVTYKLSVCKDRLTQPRLVKGRTVRGLNFFSHPEQTLLSVLQRPAYNIAGLRRADLLPFLAQCSPATLTRHLARLRLLGVIKRVTGTYRYYLTRAGRAAIAAGRSLTQLTIIPALAQ